MTPESSSKGKTGRVLLVDDDPLILKSLERMLAADGNIIQTATNGREALILFETDTFDLVILDYEMPEMNGDELALIVKALAPDQHLIMVTGYPDTLEANLLADVDLVIGKPFDPIALCSAVRKLLEKP